QARDVRDAVLLRQHDAARLLIAMIRVDRQGCSELRENAGMRGDPASPPDATLELAVLHEKVRACRRCEQAGHLVAARPIRAGGRSSDRVMVIGQAPGARSDAARRHFTGPAGNLLSSWFERAGFPPGY